MAERDDPTGSTMPPDPAGDPVGGAVGNPVGNAGPAPRPYGTRPPDRTAEVAAPQPGQARYADADGRLRPDPAPPAEGIRDPGPLGPGPRPEAPDATTDATPDATTNGALRRRPPVALTGPPVPRPGMPDALAAGAGGSLARTGRADGMTVNRPLAGPETEPTAKLLLSAAIACTCYGVVLSFLQWKSIWWMVNTPRSPDLHPLRTDVLDVIGLVATGVLAGWSLVRWGPGVRRRLEAGFRVGGVEWTGLAALGVGALLALVWFALVAVAGFGARPGQLHLIPTAYRIGGLGVLVLAVGWWCIWRDRRPPPTTYAHALPGGMPGGMSGGLPPGLPPGPPLHPPGPPPVDSAGPPPGTRGTGRSPFA